MLEPSPLRQITIRSLFRQISRHVGYLEDPDLSHDFVRLRARMKKGSPNAPLHQYRRNISTLFNINKDLQLVEDGKLSVAQARERWGFKKSSDTTIERNQESRIQIWQQHDARRFDDYNSGPLRSSRKFAEVDRKAKFSDNASRFAKTFACHKNSVVVRTIFAPYWKSSSRTRTMESRPRPVEIRSIRRESGCLSLIRVRGVKMRAIGFRRHIDDVNKNRFARISDLEFQKWLAIKYSEDPFDGEDFSEWKELLSDEIRNQKQALYQAAMKFEVQRRILVRRRAELERDWEWKFRFKAQERERHNVLNPKPLLTLNRL